MWGGKVYRSFLALTDTVIEGIENETNEDSNIMDEANRASLFG